MWPMAHSHARNTSSTSGSVRSLLPSNTVSNSSLLSWVFASLPWNREVVYKRYVFQGHGRDVNLIFKFSSIQNYVKPFTNGKYHIYKDKVLRRFIVKSTINDYFCALNPIFHETDSNYFFVARNRHSIVFRRQCPKMVAWCRHFSRRLNCRFHL